MTETATYPIRVRPSTAEKVKLEISRRHVGTGEELTLDQMIDYAVSLAAKEKLTRARVEAKS